MVYTIKLKIRFYTDVKVFDKINIISYPNKLTTKEIQKEVYNLLDFMISKTKHIKYELISYEYAKV